MDFSLNETQKMIKDMVADFAAKEIAAVAEKNNREGIFPKETLVKMAGLGLMGMNVSEEFGGANVGVVAYALALMEVSKVCASTAVAMSVTNMVAEVVEKFGTREQKSKYLPRLCSGQAITGSFVLTESAAGSDAAALKATAKKDGKNWILNGSKIFITSGAYSGVHIAWARTNSTPGHKGISAFIVEPTFPGFKVGREEDKMGLLASNTVEIIFEDCVVPEENLLGEEGGGFKIAMMALDGGRIGIASQAVGIAQAALEASIAYAKERKAFGMSLAGFQATQFKLSDMATELDAAKLLVLRAAHLKENKKPFNQEASMAKLFASEAANRITAHAVQIHGGYGYIKEYLVERLYRDARVTTIYEGTSEIQRLVIARNLLS